jgi:putative protease
MKHPYSRPELLLPVGNKKMAYAAIQGGANALYVGVPGFNARARAEEWTLKDLGEVITEAHLHNVKVHLAFNILIFEQELDQVRELLPQLLRLKPDAFIVQDLGLVSLIRSLAPEQVIHASTQMTLTNHWAIEFLADLQLQRVVLGRENSLSEIALIRQQTQTELEVFVHGALCVAYSGQCLTSESLGGRSANRGQCAQSCRLSYDLLVDGEKKDLGGRDYVFSPKDLCGLEEIKELIEIGVESFKVEGRLKSPEYVYQSAQSYQEAIRSALSEDLESGADLKAEKAKLERLYSRGFFSGWFHGVDHQTLVDGRYSSHRGQLIGTISQVLSPDTFILTPSEDLDLHLGDGLAIEVEKNAFATGVEKSENATWGGKISALKKNQYQKWVITLYRPTKNLSSNDRTKKVWLNFDQTLTSTIQKKLMDPAPERKWITSLEVIAVVNHQMNLIWTLSDPYSQNTFQGQYVSEFKTEPAQKKATSQKDFFDELSQLSRTSFFLDNFTLKGFERLYFSQKNMKALKKEWLEQMQSYLLERKSPPYSSVVTSHSERSLLPPFVQKEKGKFHLLLRSHEQVQDFLALEPQKNYPYLSGFVMLDFEFGKNYQTSMEQLRAAGYATILATHRILKPQETYHLNHLYRLKPEGFLVRNLGAMKFLSDRMNEETGLEYRSLLLGDFSLNITNHLSFDYLLQKGFDSLTASFDLNSQQLKELSAAVKLEKLEIVAHLHMPEFHMEHCVFAAFLSQGKSFRDCGKPCEKHQVQLVDSYGKKHVLKADQECRNTLYLDRSQSAAMLFSQLNPGRWRIELLEERGQDMKFVLDFYKDLTLNQGRELQNLPRQWSSYGVTALEKTGVL